MVLSQEKQAEIKKDIVGIINENRYVKGNHKMAVVNTAKIAEDFARYVNIIFGNCIEGELEEKVVKRAEPIKEMIPLF